MTKIKFLWAAVFLFTMCKAQFFYNDDEQQPAYQDPPPQDNTYQYDNPPVAQYNPSPRRSHTEPVNYKPAPRAPPLPPPAPAPVPEYEHRPAPSRSRRRGTERRERPQPPPRVYSPSVFENLAVGKPPPGVHVPENSFLNVLNGGRAPRARQSPVYEPPPSQETSYVQPPPAQPPSPPPQPRYPPAYAQSPPAVSSRPSAIESRSYSRGPAPPPRVQRTQASRPSVHNLPHVERAQPEPIENPVQYHAPAPVQPRPQRRRPSSVRPQQTTSSRSWNSDHETSRPRRVFGPSVFENLGPGMAPPGIHVPEDSFLNILRSDKHNSRIRRDQDYELSLPEAPVAQHGPVQYSTESRPSTQECSADYDPPEEIPVVHPAPRRANRQHQRPSRQPEFVDNVADHQTNEEEPRVVQQQRKPVQSRRRVSVRRHRQYSGSVPDVDENEEEIYQPPKQFGPSVFENFGLGEAPPGIHVPEDSFLNVLRGGGSVSRSSNSQQNQRPRPLPPPQEAAPEDVYERQTRRTRVSQANQSPPQRHQTITIQERQPVNAQPPREIRRPVAQQPPQPPVAPRAIQPPQRQRQRSRSQPVSAPRTQPVYEVPNAVYNARSDVLENDDIPRYRSQDNNRRTQQQVQAPPRRRVNTAPQYIPPPPPEPVYETPPPQPVYEAPPPNYDDGSSFETEDIPRRRPPSRGQRPVQIQQSVHRPQEDNRHRPPPPPQPRPTRNDEARVTRQQDRFKPAKLSVKPLPDDVDGDQIPGEAGINYPTFHVIPRTSFSCSQQDHNGYYADLETSCQVVHLCQAGGVQNSFLCPNGTIFSQEKFSCQWWYKVNCADAPSHYGINDKLYKVPSPPARRSEG